jgi:hypothetical protein
LNEAGDEKKRTTDAARGDFDRALIDWRNQGETRRVDFDRRFVKISRSAKIFPVSEHQHTPSRFDVHHRLLPSPFDAKSGSLERRRRPRRPGGKKTKKTKNLPGPFFFFIDRRLSRGARAQDYATPASDSPAAHRAVRQKNQIAETY